MLAAQQLGYLGHDSCCVSQPAGCKVSDVRVPLENPKRSDVRVSVVDIEISSVACMQALKHPKI